MLILAGVGSSGAAYISVKATLAQYLLERAWTQSSSKEQPQKPWHWADTATAARLTYTLNNKTESQSMIVLDNASGEAMAFGPGLVAGQISKASQMTVAIGGHRDTHLAFLEHATSDTRFELQLPDGSVLHYQFEDAFVVDSRSEQLQIATDHPGLVLITCYPFNALQTGGPFRLVARAKSQPATSTSPLTKS